MFDISKKHRYLCRHSVYYNFIYRETLENIYRLILRIINHKHPRTKKHTFLYVHSTFGIYYYNFMRAQTFETRYSFILRIINRKHPRAKKHIDLYVHFIFDKHHYNLIYRETFENVCTLISL